MGNPYDDWTVGVTSPHCAFHSPDGSTLLDTENRKGGFYFLSSTPTLQQTYSQAQGIGEFYATTEGTSGFEMTGIDPTQLVPHQWGIQYGWSAFLHAIVCDTRNASIPYRIRLNGGRQALDRCGMAVKLRQAWGVMGTSQLFESASIEAVDVYVNDGSFWDWMNQTALSYSPRVDHVYDVLNVGNVCNDHAYCGSGGMCCQSTDDNTFGVWGCGAEWNVGGETERRCVPRWYDQDGIDPTIDHQSTNSIDLLCDPGCVTEDHTAQCWIRLHTGCGIQMWDSIQGVSEDDSGWFLDDFDKAQNNYSACVSNDYRTRCGRSDISTHWGACCPHKGSDSKEHAANTWVLELYALQQCHHTVTKITVNSTLIGNTTSIVVDLTTMSGQNQIRNSTVVADGQSEFDRNALTSDEFQSTITREAFCYYGPHVWNSRTCTPSLMIDATPQRPPLLFTERPFNISVVFDSDALIGLELTTPSNATFLCNACRQQPWSLPATLVISNGEGNKLNVTISGDSFGVGDGGELASLQACIRDTERSDPCVTLTLVLSVQQEQSRRRLVESTEATEATGLSFPIDTDDPTSVVRYYVREGAWISDEFSMPNSLYCSNTNCEYFLLPSEDRAVELWGRRHEQHEFVRDIPSSLERVFAEYDPCPRLLNYQNHATLSVVDECVELEHHTFKIRVSGFQGFQDTLRLALGGDNFVVLDHNSSTNGDSVSSDSRVLDVLWGVLITAAATVVGVLAFRMFGGGLGFRMVRHSKATERVKTRFSLYTRSKDQP